MTSILAIIDVRVIELMNKKYFKKLSCFFMPNKHAQTTNLHAVFTHS